MAKDYFTVKHVETGGYTRYVVEGRKGEFRSSFPIGPQARLECSRLNGAFNLGRESATKKPRKKPPSDQSESNQPVPPEASTYGA
jgi:hypothetical protein